MTGRARPYDLEVSMDTRAIAVVALVIAVIVLLILVL